MRHPDVERLATIRLEWDWTYARLAAAVGINLATLYRLIQSPERRPHDRTLFKVRRFLDRTTGETPKRAARARRATRAAGARHDQRQG